jgi:predicted Zn-ribbon and HTH transcriptional regulator
MATSGGGDVKKNEQELEVEIGMVKLLGCRCRCGHEWLPRDPTEKPRVCPKCKTPNWDRPKKFERKASA